MRIKLTSYFQPALMEMDENGNRAKGYWALEINGHGPVVAIIDGVDSIESNGWVMCAVANGNHFPPSCLVGCAIIGYSGLRVVEEVVNA